MSWVYKSSNPVIIFSSTCAVGTINVAVDICLAKKSKPSFVSSVSGIGISLPCSSKSGNFPCFMALIAGNIKLETIL